LVSDKVDRIVSHQKFFKKMHDSCCSVLQYPVQYVVILWHMMTDDYDTTDSVDFFLFFFLVYILSPPEIGIVDPSTDPPPRVQLWY
jgi:hypothetical protein